MFLTPQLTKQVAAEGPGLGLEGGGNGPTAGWNSSARTAPARRAPPRVIERGVGGESRGEARRGGGRRCPPPRQRCADRRRAFDVLFLRAGTGRWNRRKWPQMISIWAAEHVGLRSLRGLLGSWLSPSAESLASSAGRFGAGAGAAAANPNKASAADASGGFGLGAGGRRFSRTTRHRRSGSSRVK